MVRAFFIVLDQLDVLLLGNFRGFFYFMKLKEAIINWLVEKENADIQEGKRLFKALFPTDHPPISRKSLVLALGMPLRRDTIPDKYYDTEAKKVEITDPTGVPPSETGRLTTRENNNSPQHNVKSLAKSQILALQEHDLVKTRAYHHQKCIDAVSDEERRKAYRDSQTVQQEIALVRKSQKDLESGIDISIDPPSKKKDKGWSQVPESLYEIEKKIRQLMSTRSKRKTRLKELETNGEKGSPEYNKTQTEFHQLDTAINELKNAKGRKIQEESAAANQ